MSSTESDETFDPATAHLNPDTVAIVTGAAHGIGKGIAEVLLKKGAKGVCLADINETRGDETLQEFKKYGEDKVIFVKCDIRSEEDLEAMFNKTKGTFGSVNMVVNNAGVQNEMKWRFCVEVNLVGTIAATYTAMKHMSLTEGGEGGMIVNIASLAGIAPVPFMPAYAATKHGVIGLTKSVMAHPATKAKGLTLCALCPAYVDTDMIKEECVVLRCDEDKPLAQYFVDKAGILDLSEVTDAFLRLVLDKSWAGKIMKISKAGGIGESPLM